MYLTVPQLARSSGMMKRNQSYLRKSFDKHGSLLQLSDFFSGPFEDKRQFNKNPKRVVPARNELYLPSACFFCEADLKNEKDNFAFCINAEAQCSLQSHLTCWAEQSLSSVATRSLVPLEAECPKCGLQSLWGDVITFKMNLSSAVHDQRNLEELQEGPLSQEIESHDNSLSDLLTLLD